MRQTLRHGLLAAAALLFTATASARAADYAARAQVLLAEGDPRGAAIELRNAVKLNPADAAAHEQLAKIDLWLGDAVAAEREARAARDHGYDPGPALSLLLNTYLAQGRYKDLLHDFPPGAADPAIAARVAVGRGRAEMALGQLDAAGADFAIARQLAPRSVEPLLAEEDLDVSRHQLAAAAQVIAAALAIDPHDREALLRKASLLLSDGDAQAAITLLGPVLNEAPSNPQVRLEMANALIGAGEDAKAAAEIKAVLAMVPGSVQGLYLRALLLARTGQDHQASLLLERLSPMMSRVPEIYLLQAEVMTRLGQWAEADNAAQQFLGHFPGDPRGERLLAEIALHAGQPQQALAALRTLPAPAQHDVATLLLSARAYAATGDLTTATDDFSAAAKLSPKLAEPHLGLAAIRLALGDTAGAAREYQQALTLAPGNSAARRALIEVAIRAGQYDLAAANLAILQRTEGDAEADAVLRGQLQLAELDIDGARATYAALLKAHPDSLAGELGLARVAALDGDTKEEQGRLMAAVAKNPTDSAALAALTSFLASQGKLTDAHTVLERAHGAAPEDNAITADLASLDISMKEPGKALDLLATENIGGNPSLLGLEIQANLAAGNQLAAQDALRTLIANTPNAVEARLTLARLLTAEKAFSAARATLEDGLAQDPGNLALLQGLVGVALNEHDPAAALAEAKMLAADSAHLPAARTLVGDFYMAQHQPAAAADAYAASFTAAPSMALVIRLATALEAAGKPAAAAARLRAYLARQPEAISVALVLGSIEIQEGQLDSAARRLQGVIAAEPTNVAALNDLAWVRSQQGEADATALAERAYFLSSDPHVADTLGWILTRQKPSQTGLALLKQAHEAAPTDPAVTYHLAAALAGLGQDAAAVSLLRPIVAGTATFTEKAAAGALLQKITSHS
ncbi:MAG TPA: XrtA/PEP-CTERM system TPR-repeat protein PrsT [Acetobacteraceae bacterium]|nr:XrtA/PEP-CTERM system TPR-repeat protein PrsT [Acetobacteraceae bacterium]